MRKPVVLLAFGLALAFGPPVVDVQPPGPFEPARKLTDAELRPPNHVLSPKNKRRFVAQEVLPVGDYLVVVLPVQLGVSYRWRPEAPGDAAEAARSREVFRVIPLPKGEDAEDLREMRPEFEVESAGSLGRVDALQVFRFQIKSAGRQVPVKFRLVNIIDGELSDLVFQAKLTTVQAGKKR